MIKRFCDICGKETERNYVEQKYSPTKGQVQCEVRVATKGGWDKGDICLACVKDVLTYGEEPIQEED